MLETKPVFIIKKYYSILTAAIVVEAVAYLVSLTDTVIAGHMLGNEAMAAIGLVSPLLSISTFLSSIIYSGFWGRKIRSDSGCTGIGKIAFT